MRTPLLLALSFLAVGQPLSAQLGFPVPGAQAPPVYTPADQGPASQRIAAAKREIAHAADQPQGYNALAEAYIRQAREAADSAVLQQAEAALRQGQALAPKDFLLAKTEVLLLLARHQFAAAQTEARLLNHRVPDDVQVYGYVTEADLALGDYTEADSEAQWMLNLRANNIAGLLLGARLRVLYGDAPGALEFLNQAYNETAPSEPEDLAEVGNAIARVQMDQGALPRASRLLQALDTQYPHFAETEENLARLRLAEGKPQEALALLARQPEKPRPALLLLMAQAQQAAGMPEAKAAYSRFEEAAEQQIGGPDEDTRELIVYLAAQPDGAARALALAQKQAAARQDVGTLDAYAWALYNNQRYPEAAENERKALAIGLHDAELEYHAAAIAQKQSRPAEAAEHASAAIAANSVSTYAEQARRLLGEAGTTAAGSPQRLQPPDTPAAPGILGVPAAPPAAQPTLPTAAFVEQQDPGTLPSALLLPRPTETAQLVHKMQLRAARSPSDAGAYAGLGAAFFQRARETGNVEDFEYAEQALTRSLSLYGSALAAAGPLETEAEVCMGEHRFRDALGYAQKALSLGSGDLSPFATVGDAHADMGDYEQAALGYARMSLSSPSEAYAHSSRTAYLTFLSGDPAAAIQGMQQAVQEGVAARLPGENLAWLYFELGEFRYLAGDVKGAGNAYYTALTVYPGDYRALAGLGKVRAAQGSYSQSVTLYQSAINVVPMPLYIAELSDVYTAMGKPAEAAQQGKLVAYIGLLGHINQVLHNRDLALFYADHQEHLAEALALARKEFEVRSDIYTWDALAWALYRNGRYAEAEDASRHALRLGTRDPNLLFHAGMIAARLGHQQQAQQWLGAALAINPRFHVLEAGVATAQLEQLQKQPGSLAAAKTGNGEQAAAHGR